MLKKLSVLVTGGMGYIGSHTAAVLTEAGHRVVLYDNLCNSKRSVQQRLKTITGRALPFINADVRDSTKLKQTLKEHHIDAVIHFAGLKAVGESVEKPIDYYDNNIAGAISLLQSMRAANVKTLVFSSSATVYGDPHYLPVDEAHPTGATNPYGRSKLHIEEMLADVAKSCNSWHIACLRYFNPVGAHESGLIGEDPNGTPNNLMPFIVQVATGKLSKLNIFGDDYDTKDGTGIRDYIHVMDLAEGHKAALKFLADNAGWHAFNLGTGTGHSVLEMIKAFEIVSGQSVPYQIAPRRAGDTAACYAKTRKAREQMGWQATLTINEMCSSTWRFQLQSESSF